MAQSQEKVARALENTKQNSRAKMALYPAPQKLISSLVNWIHIVGTGFETGCHSHHRPVSINIGGMFTIGSHGWSMTLFYPDLINKIYNDLTVLTGTMARIGQPSQHVV